MTADREALAAEIAAYLADGPLDVDVQDRRLTELAADPDMPKRAQQAAVIARVAKMQADDTRTARDQAGTALTEVHGWKPVHAYTLMKVKRGLYARIRTRCLERGLDPQYRDEGEAQRIAGLYAGMPERLDALADRAGEVRDEAIVHLLTTPASEGGMPNAEVARLTGLTTARIAQLRPATEQEPVPA
jgi:hypothetical protein